MVKVAPLGVRFFGERVQERTEARLRG
jgi:hypothetical protein